MLNVLMLGIICLMDVQFLTLLLSIFLIHLRYIPHECHRGPQHEFCRIVKKDTKKCGCEYYEAQCCCGLVMAHQEIYCENHQ